MRGKICGLYRNALVKQTAWWRSTPTRASAKGEVTPEQCHEIGVALARKVWGRRFQVLVATHMNTDNLHNHFVINSVSYVDGKKYEQCRSQYAEFRETSDKLCREYGLSVVEQPKTKEPARYARMREAIDQACEDASTAEDFHRALYRQGYIFGSDPNRKYATIRARDGGRAVRLYRLGEEYDLPAIDDRLRGNYLLYTLRHFYATYLLQEGTSKQVAASLLGHADTAFLERTYCHPQDVAKQQAAKLMQDLLNNQNPCYVAFMKNRNRKPKKAG